MAGRGPAPKPANQRHGHRSKAERELTVIEARDRFDAPPPLPEWCDGLCPEVDEWYAQWCRSPQTDTFLPTDWQRLHMVALLVDRFHRDPLTRRQTLAEIRLNESLLGATAVDRLRLGLDVKPPKPDSKLESLRRRIPVVDQ